MAFAAVNSTKEPRSFSIGPLKVQLMTYSATTGDVSGTVTADALKELHHVIIDGRIVQTGAASISGNVATLAFVNPAATIAGTVLCIGR